MLKKEGEPIEDVEKIKEAEKNTAESIKVEEETKKLLFKVVYSDEIEKIKKIINKNPELIEAKDNFDKTPLFKAISLPIGAKGRVNPEIVRFLLEKGADINIKDFRGNPLLHLAIRGENPEIVKMLLEYGADINITGRRERNTLSVAKDTRNIEIINLLEKHELYPKYDPEVYKKIYDRLDQKSKVETTEREKYSLTPEQMSKSKASTLIEVDVNVGHYKNKPLILIEGEIERCFCKPFWSVQQLKKFLQESIILQKKELSRNKLNEQIEEFNKILKTTFDFTKDNSLKEIKKHDESHSGGIRFIYVPFKYCKKIEAIRYPEKELEKMILDLEKFYQDYKDIDKNNIGIEKINFIIKKTTEFQIEVLKKNLKDLYGEKKTHPFYNKLNDLVSNYKKDEIEHILKEPKNTKEEILKKLLEQNEEYHLNDWLENQLLKNFSEKKLELQLIKKEGKKALNGKDSQIDHLTKAFINKKIELDHGFGKKQQCIIKDFIINKKETTKTISIKLQNTLTKEILEKDLLESIINEEKLNNMNGYNKFGIEKRSLNQLIILESKDRGYLIGIVKNVTYNEDLGKHLIGVKFPFNIKKGEIIATKNSFVGRVFDYNQAYNVYVNRESVREEELIEVSTDAVAAIGTPEVRQLLKSKNILKLPENLPEINSK